MQQSVDEEILRHRQCYNAANFLDECQRDQCSGDVCLRKHSLDGRVGLLEGEAAADTVDELVANLLYRRCVRLKCSNKDGAYNHQRATKEHDWVVETDVAGYWPGYQNGESKGYRHWQKPYSRAQRGLVADGLEVYRQLLKTLAIGDNCERRRECYIVVYGYEPGRVAKCEQTRRRKCSLPEQMKRKHAVFARPTLHD